MQIVQPLAAFSDLLALGRTEDYSAISGLPGAGTHADVLRVADVHRKALLAFFADLSPPDRVSFVKAVAVYENTVGGLGSVTTLHYLLPDIDDPDHAILDWILRNTKSYWYYAHSARSYDEYVAQRRWSAEQTSANILRDDERQARDMARIARDGPPEATRKLYNAVRRGDIKAVQALLLKGADASSLTPDGEPLVSFALRQHRQEIAAILQGNRLNESAP